MNFDRTPGSMLILGAILVMSALALWVAPAIMERNLLRRIETGFPILDPDLADRVRDEALTNYLADNCNAWELQSDGTYRKAQPTDDHMPHSAQASLLAKLCT